MYWFVNIRIATKGDKSFWTLCRNTAFLWTPPVPLPFFFSLQTSLFYSKCDNFFFFFSAQKMGNIDDAVPFFGKGFNKIYPLIMVIYTILIASSFFHRVIEYFGNWKIFKFQNESEDMDGFDQSGVIILKKGEQITTYWSSSYIFCLIEKHSKVLQESGGTLLAAVLHKKYYLYLKEKKNNFFKKNIRIVQIYQLWVKMKVVNCLLSFIIIKFVPYLERSGLEQGHKVGEHVIPLARNFNNVTIDIEPGSNNVVCKIIRKHFCFIIPFNKAFQWWYLCILMFILPTWIFWHSSCKFVYFFLYILIMNIWNW